MDILDHWVNGAAFAGASTRTAPVYNPAEGSVSREVRLATVADVDTAVQAAKAAFPAWAEASRRQAPVGAVRVPRAAQRAQGGGGGHPDQRARQGHLRRPRRGRARNGGRRVRHRRYRTCSRARSSENVSTGVDVYSIKQALGVVGIISPFNFPAMVPLWFFPVAIAAGNTVVLKPSGEGPVRGRDVDGRDPQGGRVSRTASSTSCTATRSRWMLSSSTRTWQSISFVGSTPIAKYIYETASKNGKRVQALGGAKNHMLVLPDADLDLVADSAVNAGFGSAGERCMAISVVVAVEPVADELIAKITVAHVRSHGRGRHASGCDMGPLITKEHRDKVAGYIDVAIADGADPSSSTAAA
jgi:malonate-semialdehyde dehydrogenase (acetylating)/methylmalonate-semialdehyde dehydrogenase